MKIKLSVPTNWQKGLLAKLNKKNIAVIYGKLEKDFIGGGRPSSMLVRVTRKEASRQISDIHKSGIKFDYLLNSLCLNNLEWTASGQREIRKLLDWLAGIGVDSVTVSMPYLLQLIKKCYSSLEVNISIGAGVANAAKAKYWEDLGANRITLVTDLNRNFALLKNIRESVKCQLQLIANLPCLFGCPFSPYHFISVGHASQAKHASKGFLIDYCSLNCKYLKLFEPWRIISCGWIRPEDMHYYDKIGIDAIKLVDRGLKTEFILPIVEAYTAQEYKGNLFDLFPDAHKFLYFSKRYSWQRIKYFLHPMKYNMFLFRRRVSPMIFDDPSFLDNRKLDGFIKFFIDGKCKSGNCDECNYCRNIANETFNIPDDYRKKMLSFCGKLANDIIDGSLFYARTKNSYKEGHANEG